MTGIGHNQGPTMEQGGAWRSYAWGRARKELLPRMPIEIVRRRVRRARELGIDYTTYAGIHATTGRDIVAFLFSSNALRLTAESRIAPAQADKLARLRDASCLALAHAPHVPERLTDENPVILRADKAPTLDTTWAEMRQAIRDLKQTIPADGLVVVGETWLEREWCAAAQLAGYLPADRYFGT